MGAERKGLVAIHGILVAAGEILGGAAFGFLGHRVTAWRGRWPIVVVGCGVSLAAYGLIALNIPNAAPRGETGDEAFIGTARKTSIAIYQQSIPLLQIKALQSSSVFDPSTTT